MVSRRTPCNEVTNNASATSGARSEQKLAPMQTTYAAYGCVFFHNPAYDFICCLCKIYILVLVDTERNNVVQLTQILYVL